MFEYLKYWVALRKLEKHKALLNRNYSKDLEKARASNADSKKYANIQGMWRHELEMLEDELGFLVTGRISSQLSKHWETLPDNSLHWRISAHYGYPILTKLGMKQAHTNLRIAREEARRGYEFWFKICTSIVTAITGVVGATTGLLVIWFR